MSAIEDPRRPFTRLDPYSYSRTLAQRLAGRRLVDPLRNLLTRFGLRHYEVRVLRLRWSGGTRYSGTEYVDRDLLIEPTPRVLGMEGLSESVEGPGVQEMGEVTVDRISTAYSEEDLRGLLRTEHEMPSDCTSCFEITFFGKPRTYRRRFNMVGVPGRKTLGWEVRLERAIGDRDGSTEDFPPSDAPNLGL